MSYLLLNRVSKDADTLDLVWETLALYRHPAFKGGPLTASKIEIGEILRQKGYEFGAKPEAPPTPGGMD